MPVNKGLLFGAAVANGLNAFLDAREKGDLQRQRQALADVEEQMKAAQLQRYQAQTTLLPQEQQLKADQEKRLMETEENRQRWRDQQDALARYKTTAGALGKVATEVGDWLGDKFDPDKIIDRKTNRIKLKNLQDEQQARAGFAKKQQELVGKLRTDGHDDIAAMLEMTNDMVAGGYGISTQNMFVKQLLNQQQLDVLNRYMAMEEGGKGPTEAEGLHAASRLGVDLPQPKPLTSDQRLGLLQMFKALGSRGIQLAQDIKTVDDMDQMFDLPPADLMTVLAKAEKGDASWATVKDDSTGSVMLWDRNDPGKKLRTLIQGKPGYESMEIKDISMLDGDRRAISKDWDNRNTTKGFHDLRFTYTQTMNLVGRFNADENDPRRIGAAEFDVMLISNYRRLLDPGSVVRESEFNVVLSMQATYEKMMATILRQLDGGGLTDETRASLLNTINGLMEGANTEYAQLYDEEVKTKGTGIIKRYDFLEKKYGEDVWQKVRFDKEGLYGAHPFKIDDKYYDESGAAVGQRGQPTFAAPIAISHLTDAEQYPGGIPQFRDQNLSPTEVRQRVDKYLQVDKFMRGKLKLSGTGGG